MREFLGGDLQEIVEKSKTLHENFRNANILILGPNGFIGNWLRESFSHLNQSLVLNIKVTGIVRKSKEIAIKSGELYREQSFQTWHDSREDPLVTHVFHCATNSRRLDDQGKESMNEVINLTTNTIQKISKNAAPKFIHLSSGAVYGESARKEKIIKITTPTESYSNLDTYGQVKLKIENLVNEATGKGQIVGGNPRLFSFFGPGLGLDLKFAISSFVKSAMNGNHIEVMGNPATERTYMYPTDLISELLKCADSPSVEPIHIGGAENMSMQEIAENVARVWNVKVETPKELLTKPNFYNPEVVDVRDSVSLSQGLSRWKDWLTAN